MRRIIMLLLAMTIVLTLCGCEASPPTPTPTPAPILTPTPSPKPKQLMLNDTIISHLKTSPLHVQNMLNMFFNVTVSDVEITKEELYDAYTYIIYYKVTLNNKETYTKSTTTIRIVHTAYEDVEKKYPYGFEPETEWFEGNRKLF